MTNDQTVRTFRSSDEGFLFAMRFVSVCSFERECLIDIHVVARVSLLVEFVRFILINVHVQHVSREYEQEKFMQMSPGVDK